MESTTVAPRQSIGINLPAGGPELSLSDILGIIFRRKRMIALVTLATAVAATVVALSIPDRFTATTTLMPPQQQQSLASALASQFGGASNVLGAMAGKDLGLKNPNEIYVAILKSRVIADSLIERFRLRKVYRKETDVDTRKRLEDATYITGARDGLVSVSVEDKDRRRCSDIANAYVDEFRKLMSRLAITEAGQRRLFFEQEVLKAKDQLASAEAALKTTQQQTGLIQLDAQARSVIESIATVKAQIAAGEVELHAAHSFATDHNPQVVLLQEQLAGLRTQLDKLESRKNAGGGDIQIAAKSVPDVGLQYIRRLRDVKYQENVFELLMKQFEISKLDEARDSAVIQVVDVAIAPDKKSFPPRGLIVVGFAILALFSASTGAIVSHRSASAQWRQSGTVRYESPLDRPGA